MAIWLKHFEQFELGQRDQCRWHWSRVIQAQAMHRRAAVAGAEQRTAWAGFWSLLLSVRENTADMSWSCREVPVLCYALGAAAFPGRAWCDHEGASALEWGLKCVVFWPLTALLTPRNHSNEFVEPASHLLAKCLCFCDFDVILLYFL